MPTSLSNRGAFVRLLCSLSFALVLALPLQTRAQDLDAAPPVGAIETGVLGEPQLVEADVGEGTELASITLRYRFDGAGDYRSLPMRPAQSPGIYVASVPTRDVQARSMEFFVVAEDVTGGRLLKGNASVPLVRELVPPTPDAGGPSGPTAPEEPIVTSTPTIGEEPESEGTGNRKYLYYVLGALAVGAIAAAASSSDGGGGSSDESCDADGCDVTLVLPVP